MKALVKEPLAGTIRLQWWLEAIGGLRAEEAAASPVMIALNDASRQTGVALAPLAAAVEARQDEPAGKPAVAAVSAILIMAARLLDADGDAIAAAAEHAAQAVTFIADDPQQARRWLRRVSRANQDLPERALPAFLPVALVPLLLRRPDAPQWRRQIALAARGLVRLSEVLDYSAATAVSPASQRSRSASARALSAALRARVLCRAAAEFAALAVEGGRLRQRREQAEIHVHRLERGRPGIDGVDSARR